MIDANWRGWWFFPLKITKKVSNNYISTYTHQKRLKICVMNYETPCTKLSQGYANLMLTALILTIFSLDKNKNFGRLNKQLSILLFNFLFKRRPVPNELAFNIQLQFLNLELFSRSAETAPVPDRTGAAMPFQCQFRLANPYGRAVLLSISVSRRGGFVASSNRLLCVLTCARFSSLWCSFLGVLVVGDVQLILLSNY